jgi:hypothetical protein
MGTTALRGLEHAAAILRLHEFMKEHLKGGTPDLIAQLNNSILTHYMRAVKENPRAPTGFSYQKCLNDESVRGAAQQELGIPVEVHQVAALRRFLASLFKNGLTGEDVTRFRRMFFGKIAGE